MATKLFLRPPHSSFLPLFYLFPTKTPSFPKPHKPLSLSPFSSQTHLSFSYGPSLRKGSFLSTPKSLAADEEEEEEEEGDADDGDSGDHVLDEGSFARVFEVAAIRVPSKDCFALESRLRGHLLNWPRIRNIARVPGDDIDDEEIAELVAVGDRGNSEEEALVSLNRRIYGRAEGDGEELSPVLRREELARKFDSRGFVRFRNLARISRPKKRKKREESEGDGKKRIGRNEFAVVEVVEDGDDDEEEGNGGDLKGLLGEEFEGRKKWRGRTRLLLLDERCSTKCVNELPEAIKVCLSLFQWS